MFQLTHSIDWYMIKLWYNIVYVWFNVSAMIVFSVDFWMTDCEFLIPLEYRRNMLMSEFLLTFLEKDN